MAPASQDAMLKTAQTLPTVLKYLSPPWRRRRMPRLLQCSAYSVLAWGERRQTAPQPAVDAGR